MNLAMIVTVTLILLRDQRRPFGLMLFLSRCTDQVILRKILLPDAQHNLSRLAVSRVKLIFLVFRSILGENHSDFTQQLNEKGNEDRLVRCRCDGDFTLLILSFSRDVKFDFKDVLIRPKRSALPSRQVVDINREFLTFPHSKKIWKGVPIVASNMDSTGTIAIAKALHKHGLLTCLHKFYTNEQLEEYRKQEFFANCMVTTGVVDEETLRKLPVGNFLWYACVGVLSC